MILGWEYGFGTIREIVCKRRRVAFQGWHRGSKVDQRVRKLLVNSEAQLFLSDSPGGMCEGCKGYKMSGWFLVTAVM